MQMGQRDIISPHNESHHDQVDEILIQETTQDNTIPTTSLPTTPLSETRLTLSDTQKIALSGALAGFIAGVSVCPLDVAKTRLQAQGLSSNTPKYRGIVGTLSTIVRDEGIPGLYRGLVPIILGYFPTWMIYFTVYEKAKLYYPGFNERHFNLDSEFINHSMSAFTAGSVSTILTNPIWVVKTRLMLQTGHNPAATPDKFIYKNTFDAFYKIYKFEGLPVLYSGLVPSLFGLFHVAIHFPVYEKLKKFFKCNDPEQTKSQRLLKLIAASSLSKMCASTLTYPHEILRTRMQIRSMTPTSSSSSASSSSSPSHNSTIKTTNTKPSLFRDRNLIKTTINIYKKEGALGFYSGFATNLARTVPASAVTLVSFEYISRYLSHHI